MSSVPGKPRPTSKTKRVHNATVTTQVVMWLMNNKEVCSKMTWRKAKETFDNLHQTDIAPKTLREAANAVGITFKGSIQPREAKRIADKSSVIGVTILQLMELIETKLADGKHSVFPADFYSAVILLKNRGSSRRILEQLGVDLPIPPSLDD